MIEYDILSREDWDVALFAARWGLGDDANRAANRLRAHDLALRKKLYLLELDDRLHAEEAARFEFEANRSSENL